MKDFQTLINPIIPFFRLIFSLFFAALACGIILFLILEFPTIETKGYIFSIIGVVVFGAGFQVYLKALITTTKSYTICNDKILEFNYLTFSSKTIERDDIKGFSTSEVPYRIWDFKQIIIYLKNGKKIDIIQFSYFNFRKVMPALLEKEYLYFGHEPYVWKWINSRIYKFEN